MSRLALVSKVLCDRELFELRRVIERQRIEIEELKMEMFWREHDISKMRRIIMLVSIHYRTRSDVVHSDESSWHQFIEPILRDFGLEVEITDEPVVRGFLEVPFASGYLQPHSDLDVHLTCTRNFTIASYGAKLCKAKSLDDPELQKLKALFDDVKEAVNNRGALSRVFNRPQADVVRA